MPKQRKDAKRPDDIWWARVRGVGLIQVRAAGYKNAHWTAAKKIRDEGHARTATIGEDMIVELWSQKRWPRRHLLDVAA